LPNVTCCVRTGVAVSGRRGNLTSGPILVVDCDQEFCAFVVGLLQDAGYSAISAETGEEGLQAALEHPPALAILDVCLPGISGYQVCREFRERFGDGLPIVFISATRTESYDRVAGLLLGGDEYLTKPIQPDEFLIRIDRLIRRSAPLDPALSDRLTRREREVLRLLAEGLTPREIASRLVIAPKTVGTHIDHIFSKLGVHSRAQAVAVAFKSGSAA
jgi:DNA-binding NarL/FixJ family response regulator